MYFEFNKKNYKKELFKEINRKIKY
jgi:hypothetical protein